VRWRAQDLAGFESHPIDALAARHDLIVVDHPGLGAAVAAGALVALDEVVEPEELRAWRHATIGGSYDSYTDAGHQWAVPIDAATQVCAFRPDLLKDAPTNWDGWLEADAGLTVAVPTAGPHTLLTFLGIAAAHDPQWRPNDRRLVPRELALPAYAMLSRAVARTPLDLRGLDPIQLLDRMAREPIAGLPLVYGYVTYSGVTPGLARIRFADAPGLDPDGTPGGVLGGTGLAISARARGNSLLLDHLRQAMHPIAQRYVIPNAGGQPSAVAAWEDPSVNAARWDFYTATRRSIDHAWRRPRFAGWIAVQRDGSAILRDAVIAGRPATEALDDLDACYRRYHPSHRSGGVA
jgi:multiple sugar transport system substrate-binding protein